MLPRLKAEETLDFVEAMLAAGGRTMSDADRKGYVERQEEFIRGRMQEKRIRPKSFEELAAWGIKVSFEH